jgi:hypothetical protein
MARMFPEWISDEQRTANPTRSAEFKVYDALARDLSDEWYVFYSSVWTWVEDRQRLRIREEDFIIAHAHFGILLLEVKGGRIEVENGQWKSVDRKGAVWEIKDPYSQVAVAERSLVRRLDEERPNPLTGYQFSTAVCFPDISLKALFNHLSPEHRHLTIDSARLGNIRETLIDILKNRSGEFSSPGEPRILWLKELIAPTWYISAPISVQISTTEQEIKRLTEEQFQVLYQLAPNMSRLLVTGCAGSGKTILAAETARRMVLREHKQVLWVCYNRNLATWIRTSTFFVDNGTMMAVNYHKLCADIAAEAGIALPDVSGTNREENAEYFAQTLPNALLEAATKIGTQFDAIIVDEGQDFLENWWTSLMLLLKENGRFHVYYDDYQRLWGSPRNIPVEVAGAIEPIVLKVNVRNTKPIHNLAMQFHPSKGKGYKAHVTSGVEPQFVPIPEGQNESQTVRTIIEFLTTSEEILPNQIAVLTPLSVVEGNSLWKPGKTLLGKYRLVHNLQTAPHEIFCSSIGAAKGLEFPVVILTELYSPYISEEISDLKAHLYVGISRARSHLVVVSSEEQFIALLES